MLSIFEKPNILLKLEGLALFLLALALYWQQSFSWSFFGLTVLLPDVALLGYMVNAKIGAQLYNVTHSKLLPSALAIIAITMSYDLCSALALIWFAHIGVDRMLGYGLKYPEGFKITHLGTIGQVTGESRFRLLPCWK